MAGAATLLKPERKAIAACAEVCAAEGATWGWKRGGAELEKAAGIPGVTASEREVASRGPHGAADPEEEVEAPEEAPEAEEANEFDCIETINCQCGLNSM